MARHVPASSIPALLAEEWTIRPDSALPSFLEVIMMQDAEHALTTTTKWVVDVIVLDQFVRPVLRRLHQLLVVHNNDNTGNNATSDRRRRDGEENSHGTHNGIRSNMWTVAVSTLATVRRITLSLAVRLTAAMERLLVLYSAEVRCLIRYCAERRWIQQSQHRNNSTSTIAESFYGAVRVKAVPMQPPKTTGEVAAAVHLPPQTLKLIPLSSTDRTKLALLIALVPYAHERLQHVYERWRAQQQPTSSHPLQPLVFNDRRLDATPAIVRLQCSFVSAFPAVVATLRVANIYCSWRYLVGLSQFTDLRNVLLRHIVRRVTQHDMANNNKSGTGNTTTTTAAAETEDHRGKEQYGATVLYIAATSLALLGWVAQLRVWYRERYQQLRQQQFMQLQSLETPTDRQGYGDTQRQMHSMMMMIPPPPPLPFNPNDVAPLLRGCPLCGRRVQSHPTATTGGTSAGFVYCLSCILPFVRQHNTCPVTGAAMYESQLVRLYEPNNSTNRPTE